MSTVNLTQKYGVIVDDAGNPFEQIRIENEFDRTLDYETFLKDPNIIFGDPAAIRNIYQNPETCNHSFYAYSDYDNCGIYFVFVYYKKMSGKFRENILKRIAEIEENTKKEKQNAEVKKKRNIEMKEQKERELYEKLRKKFETK
jgi:hypothetical protein